MRKEDLVSLSRGSSPNYTGAWIRSWTICEQKMGVGGETGINHALASAPAYQCLSLRDMQHAVRYLVQTLLEVDRQAAALCSLRSPVVSSFQSPQVSAAEPGVVDGARPTGPPNIFGRVADEFFFGHVSGFSFSYTAANSDDLSYYIARGLWVANCHLPKRSKYLIRNPISDQIDSQVVIRNGVENSAAGLYSVRSLGGWW